MQIRGQNGISTVTLRASELFADGQTYGLRYFKALRFMEIPESYGGKKKR